MQESKFTLRKDQNGIRPVYLLGNEMGYCPNQCKFCELKVTNKVTPEENIETFNELHTKYLKQIDGQYHPVIYNRGNVTDPNEFSRGTLEHILDCFNADKRIVFVSINSREKYATYETLDWLANKNLNYPIHFILGIESFSEKVIKILGKDTIGELGRFVNKLKPYNQGVSRKRYVFGLDVNLLFLPELYLNKEPRERNYIRIKEGIKNDLKQLLEYVTGDVPIEINIHPFYRIKSLPYKNADLDMLMKVLPELQRMIKHHAKISPDCQTHLFIGVEGAGYKNKYYKKEIEKWELIINEFNCIGSNSGMQNKMFFTFKV